MKIHAVFEGGGLKGIALAGAVQGAMQLGIEFDQVAGTSSGAITAALIAAGYNGEEMKKMIMQTSFQQFLKRAFWFEKSTFGSAIRFMLKKGLYSGNVLEQWIQEKLHAKRIHSFADLPKNQLRIMASDITNGKMLVLPEDIAQYGIDPQQFSIARAVRMSTSIPYFFDPVAIRPIKGPVTYIVDGALLSNFPLWIFDQEMNMKKKPVIGFQLVGRNDYQNRQITGPITMMQALIETMLGAHDERYIEKNNRIRTVKIPTMGIRSTQFELSTSSKKLLFQSGVNASEQFFLNWQPTD
jgi:NTE family protein